MASEQRLYTFSTETKEQLRKFRLTTSRAKDPQAIIYTIDKKTLEVAPDPSGTVHTDLASLADALPDNSPRFALLSYPLTLDSGRVSVPYVLVAYMPSTCNAEQRMLYAGAKELMRRESEAGRVLEVADAEEVEELEGKLKGED